MPYSDYQLDMHGNPADPDARLIAAVPDLLDALKGALAILDQLKEAGYPVHIEIREARSAIAKAEG